MLLKAFILLSAVLYRSDGYKFTVERLLSSTNPLKEKFLPEIEVTGKCEQKINLNIKVPKKISSNNPEVSVFFANDQKNILQLDMKEKIQGILYNSPYDEKAHIEGEETTTKVVDDHYIVSGSFQGSSLPKNVSKISANIVGDNEVSYNYYGLQNYVISIRDLLNVEEYRNFKCNQL